MKNIMHASSPQVAMDLQQKENTVTAKVPSLLSDSGVNGKMQPASYFRAAHSLLGTEELPKGLV